MRKRDILNICIALVLCLCAGLAWYVCLVRNADGEGTRGQPGQEGLLHLAYDVPECSMSDWSREWWVEQPVQTETMETILGGSSAIADQWGWSGYEVTAYVCNYRDSWSLGFLGEKNGNYVQLNVIPGEMRSGVFSDFWGGRENLVWGTWVDATCLGETEFQAEFSKEGYGYYCYARCSDPEEGRELIARMVRCILRGEGLDLEPHMDEIETLAEIDRIKPEIRKWEWYEIYGNTYYLILEMGAETGETKAVGGADWPEVECTQLYGGGDDWLDPGCPLETVYVPAEMLEQFGEGQTLLIQFSGNFAGSFSSGSVNVLPFEDGNLVLEGAALEREEYEAFRAMNEFVAQYSEEVAGGYWENCIPRELFRNGMTVEDTIRFIEMILTTLEEVADQDALG